MDSFDFDLETPVAGGAPRAEAAPPRGAVQHPGYCTCTTQLLFVDNGITAYYQCPVDGQIFEVEGASTLLYSETTVQTSNLFDTLIRSSAADPTNMKQHHECPRCLRKIMTFLMLGQQEKPFLTCRCGNVIAIDNATGVAAVAKKTD